jgi:hypothetical protein
MLGNLAIRGLDLVGAKKLGNNLSLILLNTYQVWLTDCEWRVTTMRIHGMTFISILTLK